MTASKEERTSWKKCLFSVFSFLGSKINRPADISDYQGIPYHLVICSTHSLIIIILGLLHWETKEDDGVVVPFFSTT